MQTLTCSSSDDPWQGRSRPTPTTWDPLSWWLGRSDHPRCQGHHLLPVYPAPWSLIPFFNTLWSDLVSHPSNQTPELNWIFCDTVGTLVQSCSETGERETNHGFIYNHTAIAHASAFSLSDPMKQVNLAKRSKSKAADFLTPGSTEAERPCTSPDLQSSAGLG